MLRQDLETHTESCSVAQFEHNPSPCSVYIYLITIRVPNTGRKAYKEACAQLGIIPVSFVLEHITEEEVNIKHHGLGPSGAKAIAIALMRNTTTTKVNLMDCAIGELGKCYGDHDYIEFRSYAKMAAAN